MEPIFVRETQNPKHLAAPTSWFSAMAEEAARQGCGFARCSADDAEHPTALLIEAWAYRPKIQGAQRWGLAADTPS